MPDRAPHISTFDWQQSVHHFIWVSAGCHSKTVYFRAQRPERIRRRWQRGRGRRIMRKGRNPRRPEDFAKPTQSCPPLLSAMKYSTHGRLPTERDSILSLCCVVKLVMQEEVTALPELDRQVPLYSFSSTDWTFLDRKKRDSKLPSHTHLPERVQAPRRDPELEDQSSKRMPLVERFFPCQLWIEKTWPCPSADFIFSSFSRRESGWWDFDLQR